jgi:hypothetical protein
MRTSTSHSPVILHDSYRDSFILLYVDDVGTSQKTHFLASTACYGDDLLFFLDDFHTSKRTRVRASEACYMESFTLLYVDDFHTSQETQITTVCYTDSVMFLWTSSIGD